MKWRRGGIRRGADALQAGAGGAPERQHRDGRGGYARLISEGLCESRPRSGIYALEQAQRVDLTDGEKPPVRWNFGTGAADAAHFLRATWARLMREVLSEQSATLLLSGDPQANRRSDGKSRAICTACAASTRRRKPSFWARARRCWSPRWSR
ncbi:MAG: hypothetical protein ACLUI3_11425 [Christensenellales bacterium]